MERPTGGQKRAAALYGGALVAATVAPALVRRVARRTGRGPAEAIVSAGLVGGAWAAIGVLERRHPFRPAWNRSDRAELTDAAHLVVGGIVAATVGAALGGPRRAVRQATPVPRLLGRLPRPVQVAVSVSAFDLVHARYHRLAHEWPPLWRFHAVHHSSTRLWWLNATRFHPLETVIDAAAEALLLDALGLDADALLAHRVLRGTFGQIQHANVALDSGPLNAVLSTPERHRWHHSTRAQEGNANYGAVVSIWDHLWGTAALPAEPFDGEIGVAGRPDYPQSYPQQLAEPLRGARQ